MSVLLQIPKKMEVQDMMATRLLLVFQGSEGVKKLACCENLIFQVEDCRYVIYIINILRIIAYKFEICRRKVLFFFKSSKEIEN